ncbi:hypothetical protein [Streptomyces heilongjiangensis]|uniref:Uncharacterized protein n=1 Tax=Streptomyces heilongjiangensis TaxID=945052 RepID=A0ABW1BC21_9ACTN|nr:hypothetical protein [Streptomyces heilongjiangensis]MDC2950292.1 hypothetical protein [Streptomyces heilongjiangensis]
MSQDNDPKRPEEVVITATDVLGTGFRASSGTRAPEEGLRADAEAALPTVVQALYADRLRSHGITEEGDRRFFTLSDERGKTLTIRLEAASLPERTVARSFVNTTSDNHVVQISDRIAPEQIGRALSHEVNELLSVRERAARAAAPAAQDMLTRRAALPARPELSDEDLGRIGELNYLAARMYDGTLTPEQRSDARGELSQLIDHTGLRPSAPAENTAAREIEQYAARIRTDIVEPHLTPQAVVALGELGKPVEQLGASDAQVVLDHRARVEQARTNQAPVGTSRSFPLPGRRPDGTPLTREELGAARDEAAQQRTSVSAQTLDQLRAEAASLPQGQYPQRQIMIGGGAALAGRDPDALLVDSRGRWHVDPIKGIVQSADQVRHLREVGWNPYEFGDPKDRVSLAALQLWEDTAATRGPLVDGRATLALDDKGRLLAEITPMDGTPPVKVEVVGTPLVATGVPPEVVPGVDRKIPTVAEATEVLDGHLTALGTPEALQARDRLAALPAGEGRAAASLEVLTDPRVAEALESATDPRVAGARTTLDAVAKWEEASNAAPGRVLLGDEVGDGTYDPTVADNWVIAGIGGGAIANTEIILEGNPNARVTMVGTAAPWVLHNDAQYLAMRRQYDAELGGNGRLVTVANQRLGAVETVRTPEGGVRLKALHVEGDAYVACLGRVARLPQAADTLDRWARQQGGQVQGELLFDKNEQYLGYRLHFHVDDRKHTVDVTGAASRMLPGNIFSQQDMAKLAVIDRKTAPPESGNVAAGFMATALQANNMAKHRAEQMTVGQSAKAPGVAPGAGGNPLSAAARLQSTQRRSTTNSPTRPTPGTTTPTQPPRIPRPPQQGGGGGTHKR